jgi:hypothetical protein
MVKTLNRVMASVKLGGLEFLFLKLAGIIIRKDMTKRYWYERLRLVPDTVIPQKLELFFCFRTGNKMYLNHPVTFNEKIQWMKAFDTNPLKTRLADKYLVRGYVEEKIGADYLIPLLGVWDRFDDIDFDMLPQSFVLKTNHGSGWNIIVKDKNRLDKEYARERFGEWMITNYAYCNGFEMHYRDIVPKIIAEPYLSVDDKLNACGELENRAGTKETDSLNDYKLFVFGGRVKLIEVDINRFTKHKRNLYTPRWELLPYSMGYPNAPEIIIDKPRQLDEMINISERLAEGFILARVDLYIHNDRVLFGEMTFTPGSGTELIFPEEFDLEMGGWIDLDTRQGIGEIE